MGIGFKAFICICIWYSLGVGSGLVMFSILFNSISSPGAMNPGH